MRNVGRVLAAGAGLVAVMAIGSPAFAGESHRAGSCPPPGMERMHELMMQGNPGMERMHKLMQDGNPGMARMHELMMRGGGCDR